MYTGISRSEGEFYMRMQFLRFETTNDKCSLLDGKKIDERVNVHFNLRGRIANNGNCYNSLSAWKIE